MIALIDTTARHALSTKLPSRVEELKKTVSASRLGLWQQCRLKFYFKYVLQLLKAPTPARHVGSVVHSVLQAYPERFAQEALGHKCKAVHRAYAKRTAVRIDSLESWERKMNANVVKVIFPQPSRASSTKPGAEQGTLFPDPTEGNDRNLTGQTVSVNCQ